MVGPQAATPCYTRGCNMNVFDQSTRQNGSEGVRVLAVSDAPVCDGMTDVFAGHVLGVHLGKAAHVRHHREDERSEGLFRHGQLTVIPAGCRISCWTRSEVNFVHVHLGTLLVERAVEHARHEVVSRFRFDDPVCRELVLSMLQQARERGLSARLYIESAAVVLAQRIAGALASSVPQIRLPPAVLRRVVDFMHETLADSPGVHELAAVANMSAPHFSRMFRATTGEPPHRYLNRIRLERAKTLLASTDHRIIEVGLAVGFGNPSHFAAFFRAATGISPAQFRRQRR